MRRLVVPAAELFLGARCAGCGGPALHLCRACGTAIAPDPVDVWPSPAPPELRHPVEVRPVAAGAHAGVLRRVVVAWKEEGVTRLTPVLAHLLAASVVTHARPGRPLLLVPVPTSRRSRRARGADLVDDLARMAARLLRGTGVDVEVQQCLVHVRATDDQAGLDAAARRVNLEGAFGVRRMPSAAVDVLVVDDVLTTCATVGEAVRALTAAGRRPTGIAVVAATPRRT